MPETQRRLVEGLESGTILVIRELRLA
jgi:hypothetical protein